MLGLAKKLLRSAGIDTTALYQSLSAASLRAAIADQGLGPTVTRLREILPDLRDQYTQAFEEVSYNRLWEVKMRGLHAWQVRLVLDVLDRIGGDGLVLADVGDSSGNHAAYVQALARPGQVASVVSVNLDPVAVEKVRAKGGEAVLCRAEEMDLQGIRPDLFMTFEMVEHLTDPLRFLHALATKGSAPYLLMTVPYSRHSRFGGHHLRLPEAQIPSGMTAEEVHIYEFSPEDWRLLARFAGYRTILERRYLQYPRFHPLRATQPLWRKLDFEGFVGFLFERDLSVSERYLDW